MTNKINKTTIRLENGQVVPVQEPVIISASRCTDIPAFYADWFFHRLNIGYSAWTNPFNGVKMYVSYAQTRFIVFWSKNPRPLIGYIDKLKERGIGTYIQYTLNDYENEKLEKGLPPIAERIDTFKRLVDILGKRSVIWRFDPLILTDNIDIEALLSKIEYIGDQLKGYTEKLVFSFVDISSYRKVKNNLESNRISYHEWTEENMKEFAQKIVKLNKLKGWNYQLATCGEKCRYPGIEPNRCIDDELIIQIASHDKELMKFLKVEIKPTPKQDLFGNTETLPLDAIMLNNGLYAIRGNNKDKGQREYCGCIKSKDIGQYNTCIHMCEYCYANTSKQAAAKNYSYHKNNPWSETIIGK